MSIPTVAVGLLTMAGLAAIEGLKPRWPAPLLVIAAAIAGVRRLLGWQRYGLELVGAIPTGLPGVTVPDLGLAAQLWPGALGMALMSFTETIAAGRAFAKSDESHHHGPMPELLATGMANAIGGFWGSMPAGGGTSQTAVNRMTGARTQIAGIVTASMALLALLLLSPLIGLMPQAVLAGSSSSIPSDPLPPADFRDILKVRRTEFALGGRCTARRHAARHLRGILVAIIFFARLARATGRESVPVAVLGRKRGTNMFRPRSPEHPDDELFPGAPAAESWRGRVFFPNAERRICRGVCVCC